MLCREVCLGRRRAPRCRRRRMGDTEPAPLAARGRLLRRVSTLSSPASPPGEGVACGPAVRAGSAVHPRRAAWRLQLQAAAVAATSAPDSPSNGEPPKWMLAIAAAPLYLQWGVARNTASRCHCWVPAGHWHQVADLTHPHSRGRLLGGHCGEPYSSQRGVRGPMRVRERWLCHWRHSARQVFQHLHFRV